MKYLIIIIALAFPFSGSAQTKPAPAKQVSSTSAPALTATFASFKQSTISHETMKRIVDAPVMVKDQKGSDYQVTGFRVRYSFKSNYEDKETGESKSFSDMRIENFYNSPTMSELWRNSIRDNAKSGDELYIDNIIVRLKNGKKMMAPTIKIKVLN